MTHYSQLGDAVGAVQRPLVVVGALLYLLLDLGWLAAANDASLSSALRQTAKLLCLGAATVVYISIAARAATRARVRWALSSALTSGLAVLVAALLVFGSSILMRRGQFFHDGASPHRIGGLLLIALGASAVCALLAPAVGAGSRRYSQK